MRQKHYFFSLINLLKISSVVLFNHLRTNGPSSRILVTRSVREKVLFVEKYMSEQSEVRVGISDEEKHASKSAVAKKLQQLNTQKKSGKASLTRAKNVLEDMVKNKSESSVSKTKIRIALRKVNSEFEIVEDIIKNMKAVVSVRRTGIEYMQYTSTCSTQVHAVQLSQITVNTL